ncbi:MAG: hypothetical protein NXY59_07915 [Aigarchaeota archaeon]|nr:hypothetical protein [Candidatus Pelearchaeum maunauluense]
MAGVRNHPKELKNDNNMTNMNRSVMNHRSKLVKDRYVEDFT